MSLTRIRGGDGQIAPDAFQQQVFCIGTTITDKPVVGTPLATGVTGSQDAKGTLAPYWAVVQKVDRDTYPKRLFIVGVVAAPKTYAE